MVDLAVLVLQLDLVILKVFSNRNDSMICRPNMVFFQCYILLALS